MWCALPLTCGSPPRALASRITPFLVEQLLTSVGFAAVSPTTLDDSLVADVDTDLALALVMDTQDAEDVRLADKLVVMEAIKPF